MSDTSSRHKNARGAVHRAMMISDLHRSWAGRTMALPGRRGAEPTKWLGRQDSNLRITGSKPVALPLGYAPTQHGMCGEIAKKQTTGNARGIGPIVWGRRCLRAPSQKVITAIQFSSKAGVWRSLVAHLVRDEGVAGSNPATPTTRCSNRRLTAVCPHCSPISASRNLQRRPLTIRLRPFCLTG